MEIIEIVAEGVASHSRNLRFKTAQLRASRASYVPFCVPISSGLNRNLLDDIIPLYGVATGLLIQLFGKLRLKAATEQVGSGCNSQVNNCQ